MSQSSSDSPGTNSSTTNSSTPRPAAPGPVARNRESVTEASLRQISDSLARIREVRRSVLELNSELNEFDQTRTLMDPGHDSILLASQDVQTDADHEPSFVMDVEDQHNHEGISIPHDRTRLRDLVGEETWERLEQFDQDRRNTPGPAPAQRPVELPPLDTTYVGPYSGATYRSANGLNSPITPFRPIIPSRRSMLETIMGRPRRDISTDDPSTSIGRRVAAREAAGPSPPESAGPSSARSPNMAELAIRSAQLDAQARRLSELQTDLQQYRAYLRERRLDPGRSLHLDPSRSRSAEMQPRSTDSPVSPLGRSPMSAITTSSRRWRYVTGLRDRERTQMSTPTSAAPTTRENSTSTTRSGSRLSLLSNMSSIQNLSSPVSARPLLFEEPASYEDVGPPRPYTEESQPGRSYSITRQVGPNGEDYVHNIPFTSSDEEDNSNVAIETWFNPIDNPRPYPPPGYVYRREPSAPSLASRRSSLFRRIDDHAAVLRPQEDQSRARGWVRLDADGNEITMEEEDELERRRTEYRLQALVRTSQAVQNARNTIAAVNTSSSTQSVSTSTDDDTIVPPRARSSSRFNPSTQPSSESEEPPHPPRVRLSGTNGQGTPRSYYGSVLDSVFAVSTDAPNPRRKSKVRPKAKDDGIVGSRVEFKSNPLPMPIEDMVSRSAQSPSMAASQSTVAVAPGNVFAGR